MNSTFDVRELYWAAGIIEGEGSFGAYGPKKNKPRVSVNMTDEDVIRRLHSVLGVGKVYGPKHYGNKPRWDWTVERRAEAVGLMMTLYPLMGQRRREKIRSILSDWRTA